MSNSFAGNVVIATLCLAGVGLIGYGLLASADVVSRTVVPRKEKKPTPTPVELSDANVEFNKRYDRGVKASTPDIAFRKEWNAQDGEIDIIKIHKDLGYGWYVSWCLETNRRFLLRIELDCALVVYERNNDGDDNELTAQRLYTNGVQDNPVVTVDLIRGNYRSL